MHVCVCVCVNDCFGGNIIRCVNNSMQYISDSESLLIIIIVMVVNGVVTLCH